MTSAGRQAALQAARRVLTLARGVTLAVAGDVRALVTFALTLALAGAAVVWFAYVAGTAFRVFCETSRAPFCGGA